MFILPYPNNSKIVRQVVSETYFKNNGCKQFNFTLVTQAKAEHRILPQKLHGGKTISLATHILFLHCIEISCQ